jgi:hypothetical protein
MGGALLLGVDEENVRRLKDGKPIHVFQAEVDNGEPITQVVVCYGRTLADIVVEFKKEGLLPPDFVMTVEKATRQ